MMMLAFTKLCMVLVCDILDYICYCIDILVVCIPFSGEWKYIINIFND